VGTSNRGILWTEPLVERFEDREELGSGVSLQAPSFAPPERPDLVVTVHPGQDVVLLGTEVTNCTFAREASILRSSTTARNTRTSRRSPLFPGEPLMILLSPGHRLVDRPVVRSDDLSGEALLTYPRVVNPILYDRVLALFDDRGYRFSTIRETDGSNLRDLMLAIASGSGVALLPASVTELSETGRIAVRRPIDPPLAMPDTIVAWPENPPRLPPPLVKTVRDLARELRQATTADVH
jgi:DNA-binding transcriptional LysR family regulator